MQRGWNSVVRHTGVFALFGIVGPWYQGFNFLDPVVLLAYGSVAALLAAPASVNAMLSPGASPAATVRRTTVYAWGSGIAILALGCVTVNASLRPPEPLLPPLPLALAIVAVSLAASFSAASAAVLAALRQGSARAAKATLRTGFLSLLLLWLFSARLLPDTWNAAFAEQTTTEGITRLAFLAAALLAVVGAALLALALKSSVAPKPPLS